MGKDRSSNANVTSRSSSGVDSGVTPRPNATIPNVNAGPPMPSEVQKQMNIAKGTIGKNKGGMSPIAPMVMALMLFTGCVQLTEQQRNDVSAANQSMVDITVSIDALEPIAIDLWSKISDVVEKMANGEIPQAKGKALIKRFREQLDPVKEKLASARDEIKVLTSKVAAINESGIGWGQQLWLLLPGLLAAAGGISNRQLKLSKERRMNGILSRAGDPMSGFGEAVHKEALLSNISPQDVHSNWLKSKG